MKFSKISSTKDKLVFTIEGSTVAYVNALRRTIVDEVPTMAIEDVEIQANNSILYDEVIAHRLGLIPLKTDLSYKLPDECSCKGAGCAKCQVEITLEAKGPCTVYAKDLKSKDPKVRPVIDEIPIVNLLEGQELKVTATAILGKGKEHQKWSGALAFYKYMPKVIQKKDVDNAEAVAKSCPVKILTAKGKKLTVKNEMDCTLCNACVETSEGAMHVEATGKDFVFTVESWGQLEPKTMVNTAFDILEKKSDLFVKSLK